MNRLGVEDLEIVGFNGTPQVECGRTLPVVRRKSDKMYCVLRSVGNSASLAWHDEKEATEFVRAKRWTRFHDPLPIPRSCISDGDGQLARQPMVVHAFQALLEMAGRVTWPAWFRDEPFLWRRLDLDRPNESVQAACTSAETVEALMDDWATGIKGRFDARFHQGHQRPALKRVADFMLCAARTRDLRWQAYLRYAMSQEPDRVRPIFDAFIQGEFSDADWPGFLKQIESLSGVLKAVQIPDIRPSSASPTQNTRSKLMNIANQIPIYVMNPAAA
ncbi:hypothetical protein [Singulisphaera acidiphila]|uniref:Uncharacterized protein n=1 Tax=Singulisphaera acidiphila (strain ATCC BAA-1392 / DSM 18658 / VKM B-2454 / MOB10) TaxID=886293 RepID=L0D6L4_SINAD|nr:hypothetical protein [Singulisphaera acidiphila]AGA24468.1 hypothetical protein Sinac_0004 [Singulisphaera acidiphila DSM 18658]